MAAVGVPIAAAWAVRHVRVEGRSLARTALGYVALLSRPSTGRVGRPPTGHAARPAPTAPVWFVDGSAE